jgi:chemotaxis response regulator CheB
MLISNNDMSDSNSIMLIGGSKSSLPQIRNFLLSIECVLNMPVVVCIPYVKASDLNYYQFLSENSTLKVRYASEGAQLKRGIVYVAPPSGQIYLLDDKKISINKEKLKYYTLPSVDLFFISASEMKTENYFAVLFPCDSNEGVFGFKSLKRANFKTILCKSDSISCQKNVNYIMRNAEPNLVLSCSELTNYFIGVNEFIEN